MRPVSPERWKTNKVSPKIAPALPWASGLSLMESLSLPINLLCSPSTDCCPRTLTCMAKGGALQLHVTHDLAVPIAKAPSLSFPHSPQRSLWDLIHILERPHHACLHPISCDYRLLWAGQSHLAKSVRQSRIPHKEGAGKKSRHLPSSWKSQRTLHAEKTKEMWVFDV